VTDDIYRFDSQMVEDALEHVDGRLAEVRFGVQEPTTQAVPRPVETDHAMVVELGHERCEKRTERATTVNEQERHLAVLRSGFEHMNSNAWCGEVDETRSHVEVD
jgi:hypothetical protein